MATVYLGLGSNLGRREGYLARALKMLGKKLKIVEVSSIYETEPQGFKEQPLFLNAVCQVSTNLKPAELLSFVKEIETKLGRKPQFQNAPRKIDIDILLYDDLSLESKSLTIPHPRMAQRAFVLVPLAEIVPELVEPVSGKSIARLLAEVEGKEGVKKYRNTGKS